MPEGIKFILRFLRGPDQAVGKDYVEITVTQCKEANLIDSTSTSYSDLSTSLFRSKAPSSLTPSASIILHLVSLLSLFFF